MSLKFLAYTTLKENGFALNVYMKQKALFCSAKIAQITRFFPSDLHNICKRKRKEDYDGVLGFLMMGLSCP
jgi:hypothetical protein